MYTNPQCRWNSQATMFSGNQRYTCTHTKTMYDVCSHSSLLASAILALGLLKKKERKKKMMNNFAWVVTTHFRFSGASQAYFGWFKGCYQRRYYCRQCIYSQISLKVWDSEKKLAQWKKTGVFVETASETPSYTIKHVFSRSWHSCKLICKHSSSIHNSSYWWVNAILTQRR